MRDVLQTTGPVHPKPHLPDSLLHFLFPRVTVSVHNNVDLGCCYSKENTLYFYEIFSLCVFKCRSLFSFQFPYFTKLQSALCVPGMDEFILSAVVVKPQRKMIELAACQSAGLGQAVYWEPSQGGWWCRVGIRACDSTTNQPVFGSLL